MKKQILRIAFWTLWPLIWLYAPLRARARVLIVCDDEYLVVRPYFGSGKWQLVGGGIKFGETAADAAVREAAEEVSLRLTKALPLVPVATYQESGLLLRYVLFYAEVTDKNEVVCNSEIAACSWLSLGTKTGVAPHVIQALNGYDKVRLLK